MGLQAKRSIVPGDVSIGTMYETVKLPKFCFFATKPKFEDTSNSEPLSDGSHDDNVDFDDEYDSTESMPGVIVFSNEYQACGVSEANYGLN